MPYIVTTKRLDSSTGWDDSGLRVSRRAVATLDEARSLAWEFVYAGDPGPGGYFTAASTLPESGGTVGPLPDGTIIEVEPIWWWDLARQVGRPDPPAFVADGAKRLILDAFNAQQPGTRASEHRRAQA